jgi:RNA polymerase sigma-70 factor (ECF subfamily)
MKVLTLRVLPEPSPGGSEPDIDAPANDRPLDDAHARFLQLARRDLDRAYRLAGLILGDALEAEDAVQDALLRAWRSVGTLRDLEGFQAWFDRILVNGCRDRLRRRRTIRFIPLDPSVDPAVPSDPFRAIAERDALLGGLTALDPDERVVIVLHYWADLSLEQIAARIGTPLGTVKSRLHRARNRLRTELERQAPPTPTPPTSGPTLADQEHDA